MPKRTRTPKAMAGNVLPAAEINNRADLERYLATDLHDLFDTCIDLTGAEVSCNDFLCQVFMDLLDFFECVEAMLRTRCPIEIISESADSLPKIAEAIEGLAQKSQDHVSYTNSNGLYGQIAAVTWTTLARLAKSAAEDTERDVGLRLLSDLRSEIELGRLGLANRESEETTA